MDTLKDVGDTLIDTISALAFEVSRRVIEEVTHQRAPENKALALKDMRRIVHKQTTDVMIDYFRGTFKPAPYIIGADPPSITCMRCSATSYNKNDIDQRYCASCKRFFKPWERQ